MNTLWNRARDRRDGDQGFTLVELLVVIVIIGILVAIAIPVFLSQREKGWASAAQSDLRNSAPIAETFFADNGTYLASTETGMNESPDVDARRSIRWYRHRLLHRGDARQDRGQDLEPGQLHRQGHRGRLLRSTSRTTARGASSDAPRAGTTRSTHVLSPLAPALTS